MSSRLISPCEPQSLYLQHGNHSQNLVRDQYDDAYDVRFCPSVLNLKRGVWSAPPTRLPVVQLGGGGRFPLAHLSRAEPSLTQPNVGLFEPDSSAGLTLMTT